MVELALPKRRPLYNLFLTVSVVCIFALICMAGYYSFLVADANLATVNSGVEIVLSMIIAITLACVLVVNVIYTRESIRIVERTLVHVKYWFVFRLQEEISLDEIQKIRVAANNAVSGFSESQDFALMQFGYMELLTENSQFVIGKGYSLKALNSLAKKVSGYFAKPVGGKEPAMIELYEHLSGIEGQTESPAGNTIVLKTNSALHHNSIKSIMISGVLFLLAGVVAYIDHNPTEAMLVKQGHVTGETAPLYFAFTAIAAIYFGLFCWYFRKSNPVSKISPTSSSLLVFGYARNGQSMILQIPKNQIAVAYVDNHSSGTGGERFELVLMDHAMNPTVLVLDGEQKSLLKAAYAINAWLKS